MFFAGYSEGLCSGCLEAQIKSAFRCLQGINRKLYLGDTQRPETAFKSLGSSTSREVTVVQIGASNPQMCLTREKTGQEMIVRWGV